MFRASLCPSSGEQDVCYCMWCAALVLLDVVGSAPQPLPTNPAEPAQHTTCSNIRLVLLKMGIMMPETCWEIVKNKHLTVASRWFSLSLHENPLFSVLELFSNTLRCKDYTASWQTNEDGALVQWYSQEKTEILGEKPVPVPLRLP